MKICCITAIICMSIYSYAWVHVEVINARVTIEAVKEGCT